jgi:hypothetical protein
MEERKNMQGGLRQDVRMLGPHLSDGEVIKAHINNW